jgi:hypothetical protein
VANRGAAHSPGRRGNLATCGVCYADGVDNSQPKKRLSVGSIARLTFRSLALATLVALVAGWVVSYWRVLTLTHQTATHKTFVISCYGLVGYVSWRFPLLPPGVPFWHVDAEEPNIRTLDSFKKPFRFEVGESSPTPYMPYLVCAPYWFLSTLAAFTVALSFKRTWRFTTRQLLIATTAIAALLAAGVWSMRG